MTPKPLATELPAVDLAFPILTRPSLTSARQAVCSPLIMVLAAALLGGSLAAWADDGGIRLIDERTPWRAYVFTTYMVNETEDGTVEIGRRSARITLNPADPKMHEQQLDRVAAFSPLPPRDWMNADFDDYHWPQYLGDELYDYLGDYGVAPDGTSWGAPWLYGLQLRTRFGIEDPAKVRDLKVTVRAIGGGVVYVNGVKIGSAYMPEGEIFPLTLAVKYPAEAYTDADGEVLPAIGSRDKPDPKLLDRYEKRIRSFTFEVPRAVLRPGANVLAVDLRRAPSAGPMGRRDHWNHLGFNKVTLTSASGAGVIAFDDAVKGTRLWSVPAEQQIAQTPSERSLIRRGWGWTLLWARGMPVKGVAMGNPFDPPHPIRMAAPRNGVCSGQVVLIDPAGLKQVQARLTGPLQGAGRASIPTAAVDIRYAVQTEDPHYCDALLARPPDNATTLPIWLLVEVPADQPPGWYTTQLEVRANGQRLTTPVQVLVTGLKLPAPRDYRGSTIAMPHCPKNIAMTYNVELWSDRHWELLEASLALLGKVSNDVIDIPVILSNFPVAGRPHPMGRQTDQRTWHAPMIRWIQTRDGLRPDLSLLEKYLDLSVKHAGPPRAISLWIWDPPSAVELARAYEGTRHDTVEQKQRAPVLIEVYDPATRKTRQQEVPHLMQDDARAFWKPMFDAVHALVKKRGWSENIIMLGRGSDVRPGQRTGDRVREWAPYARWDLLSHYSGETPGVVEDGRLFATGGLEIGVKRYPWMRVRGALSSKDYEARMKQDVPWVDLPTARWHHQPYSPPITFRTLPLLYGRLGQVGLDYWTPRREGPTNRTFFSHVDALAYPGPDGAVPTVRFQMLREGVQDLEVRHAIREAYMKLPESARAKPRELLDDFNNRLDVHFYLSQRELALDWPGYVAQVQELAAMLTGAGSEARWDQPPDER
jgi:hypothetical protein